jgi:hypothetical protein
VNRFGLPRDIPDPIKRLVRQRDGFGCVVCGSAFFDYEHFAPPYVDAAEHRAQGIILLCPNCHRKKGNFLSIEHIAAAAKKPKCREIGFSFGAFDLGSGHPGVRLGTNTFLNISKLINIFGDDVLSIDPPEEPNGPFRLSAEFRDENGTQIFTIDQNNWQTPAENWDVEIVGPKISIRERERKISLCLVSVPPTSLIVERMNMFHRGVQLSVDSDGEFEAKVGPRSFLANANIVDGYSHGLMIGPSGLQFGFGGRGRTTFGVLRMTSRGGDDSPVGLNRPVQDTANGPVGGISDRQSALGFGRNKMCYCGSGARFKRCHGIVK